MTNFTQALRWGEQGLEAALALALAIMVALVFGNVVLRYGFNSGLALSEEAARFLFVWSTFVGAIVAARRSEHIRAEFLRARLGDGARRWLDITSEAVVAVCCALLIDGGWRLAMLNASNISPISGWPLSIVYIAGVVSGVVLLAIALARLWLLVVGRSVGHPLNAPPVHVTQVD